MPPAGREREDDDPAPPSKRGRYDSDDLDDVDLAAAVRADILHMGEVVSVLSFLQLLPKLPPKHHSPRLRAQHLCYHRHVRHCTRALGSV